MSYYHYENRFDIMDSLEGLIDPLGSLEHNLQCKSTRIWLYKQAAVGGGEVMSQAEPYIHILGIESRVFTHILLNKLGGSHTMS